MIASLRSELEERLPQSFKESWMIKLFGFKIPLLGFCGPKLIELTQNRCEIQIPLNFKTKNHIGSLYFGTLACGADMAAGLMAMKLIRESEKNISLVFKDFKADFLKRAEGPTHFICTEGEKVRALMARTLESGERENELINVYATVPTKLGDEPVANFTLTLSLKLKK